MLATCPSFSPTQRRITTVTLIRIAPDRRTASDETRPVTCRPRPTPSTAPLRGCNVAQWPPSSRPLLPLASGAVWQVRALALALRSFSHPLRSRAPAARLLTSCWCLAVHAKRNHRALPDAPAPCREAAAGGSGGAMPRRPHAGPSGRGKPFQPCDPHHQVLRQLCWWVLPRQRCSWPRITLRRRF